MKIVYSLHFVWRRIIDSKEDTHTHLYIYKAASSASGSKVEPSQRKDHTRVRCR